MLSKIKAFINGSLYGTLHIAPLAVLRMVFGAVMFISTLRFMYKGWVHYFYIKPQFFFTFYGFGWVRPLPGALMYAVFVAMAVTSLFIVLGFLYRLSITVFFTCFVYVELIDKTYYLNHYYLVSVICFLLMLVPAQRYFSVDVLLRPSIKRTTVPAWTINIFKAQLCLIYLCAGISKLTYDWMFAAMPLKIWLPANGFTPIVGPLFREEWLAYAFSWFGAVFDLFIWALLLSKRTNKIAYTVVVIFHLATAFLFKIGMFPYIMICVTTIFFSESFHIQLINRMRGIFNRNVEREIELPVRYHYPVSTRRLLYVILPLHVLLQIFLPFRYLLYPGNLLWTEEGYRFSWRVMLMEKSGTAFFYVTDPATGRQSEVITRRHLTAIQERMMYTQPDMILQYAHYLADVYRKQGIKAPVVTVESYVTLNGSGSRLFINTHTNLAAQQESFKPKDWILPFQQNNN